MVSIFKSAATPLSGWISEAYTAKMDDSIFHDPSPLLEFEFSFNLSPLQDFPIKLRIEGKVILRGQVEPTGFVGV